ncbi:MAG: family 16 glycosylhydrolase [Chitinivibrionales bacterium]|nr:family 16 glycosylhydrolase [Chitinivibrionales bacterium]MBD3394076.1 family 16 glycosylhydrolase [Chitinivibrionales bacterium]
MPGCAGAAKGRAKGSLANAVLEAAADNSAWIVATWSEHGGQTGTERCFVQDGLLHMQFINSSTDGFLGSAIQTRDEYLFGTWEMRAKPSDVPGVLNSLYTIDWIRFTPCGASMGAIRQQASGFRGNAGGALVPRTFGRNRGGTWERLAFQRTDRIFLSTTGLCTARSPALMSMPVAC